MHPIERPFAAWCLIAGWLFFLVATVQVTQLWPMPFPFINIDEQMHYSYTLDVLKNHHWWPDLTSFKVYDVKTGAPTAELNYLNHPPTFYWMMALVQMVFPHADPVHYRLVPLAFYLVAMGLYARLGYLLKLPHAVTFVYALIPILFYMPLQSGYYNNDSVAICGGAITCYGSFLWFSGKPAKRAFLLMLLGITLASVKLTALVLVGSYGFFALLHAPAQLRQVPKHTLVLAFLWCGVLALPFLYYWLHYGSPAPQNEAQIAMVLKNAAKWGWDERPRYGFFRFLLIALSQFADQFNVPEFTFVPLLALAFSFLVYFILPRRAPSAIEAMTRTAIIATLLTLIPNMIFAWQRYKAYGWLLDMFVRYYFPLLPAYGAAIAGAYLRLSAPQKSLDSPHAS